MKYLSRLIALVVMSVSLFGVITPVFAQDAASSATTAPTVTNSAQAACQGAGGSFTDGKCVTQGETTTLEGTIKNIVNILIFIIGAASVLMIIIGGFRYVLSGGDSAGVEGAKNTILYSIIGVVVAILSYAIVNFVIFNITK